MEFSGNAFLDVYKGNIGTLRDIASRHDAAYHVMMSDIYSKARCVHIGWAIKIVTDQMLALVQQVESCQKLRLQNLIWIHSKSEVFIVSLVRESPTSYVMCLLFECNLLILSQSIIGPIPVPSPQLSRQVSLFSSFLFVIGIAPIPPDNGLHLP